MQIAIRRLLLIASICMAPSVWAQSATCFDKNIQYWQAFPPGGESDLSARHQQVVLKKNAPASTPSSSTRRALAVP